MPDDKHNIGKFNNDNPVKIPGHQYVLVNRCGIVAENNFLLESLAACHDAKSKLVKYYTVNTTSVGYLDNMTESLKFPIMLNRTTNEQTLPISLHSFKFDSDLLKL